MNIFFGPAGRQFDRHELRISRNEAVLERYLEALGNSSVDTILNQLAQIYVAGMHAGIQAGFIGHYVRWISGNIKGKVIKLESAATVCDQELSTLLVAALNEADSVEFLTMDELIETQLCEANHLVDSDDLELLPAITVDEELFFAVFLGGWQFGYQNYLYELWQRQRQRPDYDDGRRYRNAEKMAQQIAKTMQLADFGCPNTKQYILDQTIKDINDFNELY